ncbi:MAG: cation:proton antiporter [Betaproteobacteria bacterium]|nr:cation:proton antiporter [Betaproteobacteria bacterium]
MLLFIPPLLFADARVLPRRDLLQVLRPVLLLALGLVVLTVVVVGYTLHWLVPSMPLAVAFTLAPSSRPPTPWPPWPPRRGCHCPTRCRTSSTPRACSTTPPAWWLKLAVAAAAAAAGFSTTDVAVNFRSCRAVASAPATSSSGWGASCASASSTSAWTTRCCRRC